MSSSSQQPPHNQHATPKAEPSTTSSNDNDMNTSFSSTGSGGRRRKSHPWQTDVKLNRFTGGNNSSRNLNAAVQVVQVSSSTQKSTMGWKQRMQERKAVFGNVAVPEQIHENEDATSDYTGSRCKNYEGDEEAEQERDGESQSNNSKQEEGDGSQDCRNSNDDDHGGDDDGDYESCSESQSDEGDKEAIHNEAVALLASRGFQVKALLQHQYEDDLESVGHATSVTRNKSLSLKGSSSHDSSQSITSSTSEGGGSGTHIKHNLRLDEIQTLRRKILLQKIDRDESAPAKSPKEDHQEPFDESNPDASHAAAATSDQPTGQALVEKDSKAMAKCHESAPAEDNTSDAAKAWRVMKELKTRLMDVFTEDHVILEAMGRKGLASPSESRIVVDQNAWSRHKLRHAMEKRVSLIFTGDHQIVVNGEVQKDSDSESDDDDKVLDSLLQESLSGNTTTPNGSPANKDGNNHSMHLTDGKTDDDEGKDALPPAKSPELQKRLSDSFTLFESIVKARQQVSMADDEWTVVEESTVRNAPGMLPSLPNTQSGNPNDDDQSCWTEYTVETEEVADGGECDNNHSQSSLGKELSGCMDDSRKTIKLSNTQAVKMSSLMSGEMKDSDDAADDYTYAECTVHDQASGAVNPFRMPGQAQLEVNTRREESDDQSYMELTVRDDESSMEYTVQDSTVFAPPTRLPIPTQHRRAPSDDQSYMEFTVRDDGEDHGTPNDLTSPHLQNMLSSRMFADMELPETLKQQKPPQSNLEDDNQYPTITIDHDDDDMTQITFDHTMMDDGDDHHLPPTPYANNSRGNKRCSMTTFAPLPTGAGGSKFATDADFPSVVGSLHTEQTRDTTVSDDASSQLDGASFKSCVSSESTQSVAELLRRDVWSPDPAVVHNALEKLAQAAEKGHHERAAVVRYGGLLAILRAMEIQQDKAPIQIAACVALEKIAVEFSTKVAIGEVGCIPAIAKAMKGHVDNIGVQRMACSALACLTRHSDDENDHSTHSSASADDQVPTQGVVEAVTHTMKLHPEDPEIQANSFKTLANLCLDNRDRLRELKTLGGLAAMTTALQVPWSNKTDQHESISTLSILLRSLAGIDLRC